MMIRKKYFVATFQHFKLEALRLTKNRPIFIYTKLPWVLEVLCMIHDERLQLSFECDLLLALINLIFSFERRLEKIETSD